MSFPAEEALGLFEEGLELRIRIFARNRGELVELLALGAGEPGRHFDEDTDVLVAMAATAACGVGPKSRPTASSARARSTSSRVNAWVCPS